MTEVKNAAVALFQGKRRLSSVHRDCLCFSDDFLLLKNENLGVESGLDSDFIFLDFSLSGFLFPSTKLTNDRNRIKTECLLYCDSFLTFRVKYKQK